MPTYWKVVGIVHLEGSSRPESHVVAKEGLGQFGTREEACEEIRSKIDDYAAFLEDAVGRRNVQYSGLHVEKVTTPD